MWCIKCQVLWDPIYINVNIYLLTGCPLPKKKKIVILISDRKKDTLACTDINLLPSVVPPCELIGETTKSMRLCGSKSVNPLSVY